MPVTTKLGLRDYCLRELGSPLKRIHITDEQMEDRIDQSLEFFREYHFDGIKKVYLMHQLTQQNIDEKKIVLNDSLIYGVTKVHHTGSALTTNNLFSLEYQLRVQDMYSLLGADLIQYEITFQHLSMLQHLLVGHKMFRYNRIENVIYLDQDLNRNFNAGDYIMVECYRVLDPSEATLVWNNQWLKHYVTAQFKRQWATNIKSWQGMQLPGGVTIDGDALYDEANQEINELEEELMSKSAPIEFFVG